MSALSSTPSFATGQRLQDKVCIVTGSSSGLGRAICLAFASQGARLVVCADLKPTSKSTFQAEDAGTPTHEVICKRYGENKGIFVQTDVTIGSEVEVLVQEAVKVGGRLDVIANNAGIGGTENHGQVHEMTEETWDKVMSINSRSVFLGCKFACAQFLKQEPHPSGHRGWIINTASIMGLVGQMVNGAAYCASKGAVVLLTKSVAVAYAKHKIHCNALCPGHLRTPMTEDQYKDPNQRSAISALTPWGDEWGAAEDVARCAVFLASDDAAYVTGVPLPVDGGYCAQ
ncbi:MAG: hypothetical protein Q9217_001111 [Psora testacea]